MLNQKEVDKKCLAWPAVEFLRGTARQIRVDTLRAIHAVGTGHAGSSLSMVEILVSLYFAVARHRPHQPDWEERDRIILSKGHGSPSYYATLARAGYFPVDRMGELRRLGSGLQGHPKRGALPGVDASTGSLGQGASFALGLSLGLKAKGSPAHVFCILGDGELQEGQNWEAFMAGAAFRPGNLLIIVDRNRLQNDGPTEELIPLRTLSEKLHAFGWRAMKVDGHDFEALRDAFNYALNGDPTPCALIANTVKGKGVSFMEGVVKWHHHPISDAELAAALRDLTPSPQLEQ